MTVDGSVLMEPRPADCECGYPCVVSDNGSLHATHCPADRRWNGWVKLISQKGITVYINPGTRFFPDLPDGAKEEGESPWPYRTAWQMLDGRYIFYCYCPHCIGWIEGFPPQLYDEKTGSERDLCLRCMSELQRVETP